MSDPIIIVENLSKRYTIQHQLNRGDGFRHVLQEKITAPFRALFGKNGSAHPPSAGSDSQQEDFWALKNVSFEVKRGEVVGIVGRNGAGKSTLLKILSRITEPTEGRVRLRGRVASLLEVGTGFHPELTGRENIFLNGSILGMSKAEIKRKFDEIVAFSEVEKFLDTPVKRYSSGMYVRLAFAVAAHLEPEILIVDEVLAVGDASFQKKCLGKMKDVSKGGRTVLFVSHNMTAVRSLCDRGVLLRNGQVAADAGTDDILRLYQNRAFNEAFHREWISPQPHEPVYKSGLYLKEAAIFLNSGDETLGVNSTFSLGFCIHSRREALINISPHYLGSTGEVIFAAPSPVRKIQAGDNWFICRMPGNFLNDGIYFVQLMIVEDSTAIQVVDEALAFEVHDDVVRKGKWHGKWPGVVRPMLEWNFQPPKVAAPGQPPEYSAPS